MTYGNDASRYGASSYDVFRTAKLRLNTGIAAFVLNHPGNLLRGGIKTLNLGRLARPDWFAWRLFCCSTAELPIESFHFGMF